MQGFMEQPVEFKNLIVFIVFIVYERFVKQILGEAVLNSSIGSTGL